jgi:hypothetical protein
MVMNGMSLIARFIGFTSATPAQNVGWYIITVYVHMGVNMKKLIVLLFSVLLMGCGLGDGDGSHDHIGIINGTLTSKAPVTTIVVTDDIINESSSIEVDASNSTTIKASVRKAMEYAYFEGQKDYSEGDVRIQLREDGRWEWTKSCWD